MSLAAIGTQMTELLQVAEAVAREKGIEQEEVLEAMELAIGRAGRLKYGQEYDIRAQIDRKTGEPKLFRYREVVEEVTEEEEAVGQITLDEAREIKPDATLGDVLTDPLPPVDFGRIATHTAKQAIVQRVREAEREKQYEEYKDRVGTIVNGLVKRAERGFVLVDLGQAEAVMRHDECLPREPYQQGNRVRAYIYDVRRDERRHQIHLSRTRNEFMAGLFRQEVPEIYDGIIEIKKVARDPGSRAKIAVMSHDAHIDPVGACVGMRGSRVQAVVSELQGERIDIIPWSPDPATFVVNALVPAEVAKVVLDEDTGKVEVVVPDEQQSLAIGRRGQNVRLATQLTGWQIDILTEEQESERRQQERRERSDRFIEALDVDDVLAHLLVTEGFSTVEEVAFVPIEDLVTIESLDEEIAVELQTRAREFLEAERNRLDELRKSLGIEDDLAGLESLSGQMMVTLGENEVKTLENFADLSVDEILSPEDGLLRDFDLTGDQVHEMIMAARVAAGWFTAEELAEWQREVDAEVEEEGEEEGEEAGEKAGEKAGEATGEATGAEIVADAAASDMATGDTAAESAGSGDTAPESAPESGEAPAGR